MSPWRSLPLDLAAIAIFAAIGRSSHAEGVSLSGVLGTAWPFFAGCLVGTIAARIGRASYWFSGLVIWLSTLIVGMILRVLTGPGTALSFTIVATITLGVFLLGWRAVVAVVRRPRTPPEPLTKGPETPLSSSPYAP